jgi:ATP-dependent RNA helicase RhlE
LTQSFADLGLAAELVRAVAEEGYAVPTPVQAKAIPPILEGRDVLAGAQTGTGKTAGFTLPLLQRLTRHAHHGGRHSIRALILTPTRELAAQVDESVRTYGRHLKLRTALVYGGVGFAPQVETLKRGVDILVATPGRLLDHLGQKTVSLAHVELLVLDEADRMLDMGFIHDIRKVLAVLPPQRQNLLFSATYSDEIRTLANSILRNPVLVEVARRNAESALVTQRAHPVDHGRKRALLAHLVASGDWRQVLVFTRTKHGANRLAEQLCKDGIEATAIHGNKSQGARTRALAGFKAGEVRVLVATDIAARGLDIEQLPHVVNYELPNVPEHYVHRIGRTGRAGRPGEAISLVSPDEHAYLADIEKLLKRRLECEVVPGFEPGTSPQAPRADVARAGRPAPNEPRHAPRAKPPGPRPAAPRPQQRPARPPHPAPHARGWTEPAHAQPTTRPVPDPERQPASHANAQFPSSGPAQPAPLRRGGLRDRGRQAEVPALLRGASRRTA